MKDFERASEPTYKEMARVYNEWFSTGYFKSIQDKLALFDLIGWLVTSLQKKKPDVTYYQIVHKLAKGTGLTEMDIKKIAIISEDLAYECDDFIDFGLKLNEVPAKIKELLCKMLPF